VLQDQTNITNFGDSTLEDLLDAWGQVTPPLVASKLANLLKVAFDKEDDIKLTLELLEEELDLDEDYMPSDDEFYSDDDDDDDDEDLATTPMTRVLPKQAPKKVTPVNYKHDIFKYHKFIGGGVEVPKETMKTNLKRCKKQIIQALNYCGSEQHQMYMIHKVLTKGARAGIGMGLGVLAYQSHP
jgi:hypothetical protein